MQGQVQQTAKKFFELLSERQRDLYMVSPRYGRPEQWKDYRNGYYTRDPLWDVAVADRAYA